MLKDTEWWKFYHDALLAGESFVLYTFSVSCSLSQCFFDEESIPLFLAFPQLLFVSSVCLQHSFDSTWQKQDVSLCDVQNWVKEALIIKSLSLQLPV